MDSTRRRRRRWTLHRPAAAASSSSSSSLRPQSTAPLPLRPVDIPISPSFSASSSSGRPRKTSNSKTQWKDAGVRWEFCTDNMMLDKNSAWKLLDLLCNLCHFNEQTGRLVVAYYECCNIYCLRCTPYTSPSDCDLLVLNLGLPENGWQVCELGPLKWTASPYAIWNDTVYSAKYVDFSNAILKARTLGKRGSKWRFMMRFRFDPSSRLIAGEGKLFKVTVRYNKSHCVRSREKVTLGIEMLDVMDFEPTSVWEKLPSLESRELEYSGHLKISSGKLITFFSSKDADCEKTKLCQLDFTSATPYWKIFPLGKQGSKIYHCLGWDVFEDCLVLVGSRGTNRVECIKYRNSKGNPASVKTLEPLLAGRKKYVVQKNSVVFVWNSILHVVGGRDSFQDSLDRITFTGSRPTIAQGFDDIEQLDLREAFAELQL